MHITLKTLIIAFPMMAIAYWVSASGSGTLTPSSGWYRAGTNLTVTAIPDDIYTRFEGWYGDTNGIAGVDSANVSFTVGRARRFTAAFGLIRTTEGSVPYQWLAAWTNEYEMAVTNDWDGDGFTTAEEYWSGTDPDNPDSFLHISGLERAGSVVRFAWSHSQVDNRIPPIRIEQCTDLLNGLWEYVDAVSPTNGVNYFVPPAGEQGYYRLAVTNAP